MRVARCVLFVVCCLPFVVCRLLSVCSDVVVRRPFCVVCYVLFVVVLFVVRCLLYVVCDVCVVAC